MVSGHTEDNDYKVARNSIQKWMNTVMFENRWSAEEWARKARTSATNITRAISADNGGKGSLPNSETLMRLAQSAGSMPDLLGHRSGEHMVPLLSPAQLALYLKVSGSRRQGWLLEQARAQVTLPLIGKVRPTAFAVAIQQDSLRGRGIYEGDIALVEPADFTPADTGKVVVAVVEDLIGCWLWFPPLLVPAHDSLEPVEADHKTTKMLGRLVQIFRSYT